MRTEQEEGVRTQWEDGVRTQREGRVRTQQEYHQLPELAQMIDFMLKHLWTWNYKGCIFSGPHPVGNIFPIIF